MKIDEIRVSISSALAAIGKELSKPKLELKTIADLMNLVRKTEKVLEEDEEILKPHIVEALKSKGTTPEGQKQKILSVGGWVLKMHPTKTGLDPKKVETGLVMKDKDPKKYMIEVKSYKLPIEGSREEAKLKALFTEAELKDMEYTESWTVKTPTEE